MALCHPYIKIMINDCRLGGSLISMKQGIKQKTNTLYLDFVLKTKRDEPGIDIYDYIDCSVYGDKARKFIEETEIGDVIILSGQFRSSKVLINNRLQDNRFSHFLVGKYTILAKNQQFNEVENDHQNKKKHLNEVKMSI